ncbi:MAG: ATP-binding protein [Bacteroidales bacterium]|jgi:nitrogen fixation/metabolism regulation signal transduction histidine kinase|nr:ATP-binding protein [Bacteroidales bacterium]
MKRGETTSFIITVILLAVVSGVLTWLLFIGQYVFVFLAGFVLIMLFSFAFKLFLSARRKTAFMFNALENNDFTFRFREDFRNNSDRMLNASLNRIKDILGKAKIDAIEREKYYELIMNCVDTAIIVLDERGMVYQTNNHALHLLGLSTFTHVDQLRVIDRELVDAFRDAQPGSRFQQSFTNERGTVTLVISVSSFVAGDRTLRIIAANDINSSLDEKEIESWSRLIRVLTHEIMNSITPITSLSETLININEGGNEEITQGLEVIRTTAKSLISFVDAYRRLTRIPMPEKHPFYIKPFLERQIRLGIRALDGSVNQLVRTSVSIDNPELLLYGDEDLLGQVVSNLIKNALQAIEHTLAGNRHTVEDYVPLLSLHAYTNEAQEILIEVSDNAGGIPQEIVQNMFVPFFTTKENGSGIGLSLSRQIMRLHKASLKLTSNTTAKTTFTLCF